MRYAVVLLAVFGLMAVGCGGGTPEEKMGKASEAFTDGDFDKAISICKDLCEDADTPAEIKASAEALIGTSEAAKAAEEAKKKLEDAVSGD